MAPEILRSLRIRLRVRLDEWVRAEANRRGMSRERLIALLIEKASGNEEYRTFSGLRDYTTALYNWIQALSFVRDQGDPEKIMQVVNEQMKDFLAARDALSNAYIDPSRPLLNEVSERILDIGRTLRSHRKDAKKEGLDKLEELEELIASFKENS